MFSPSPVSLSLHCTVLHVLCFLSKAHSHTKLPQCPMLSHCWCSRLCSSILFCVRGKMPADTPSILNLQLLCPNSLQMANVLRVDKSQTPGMLGKHCRQTKQVDLRCIRLPFRVFHVLLPHPYHVLASTFLYRNPCTLTQCFLFRFSEQSDFLP